MYVPYDETHVVFFNDTATTEIYTLSLHDALPISRADADRDAVDDRGPVVPEHEVLAVQSSCHAGEASLTKPRVIKDRKSTRLNSSHANISYAVFCLKKKNNPLFISNIILFYGLAV